MDLPLIILLYCVGLALIVAEALLPGMVIGLIGTAALGVSTLYAFMQNTALGIALVVVAAVFVPAVILWGLKRMALKTTLSAEEGALSHKGDYALLIGKEGEATTPLHPSGIVAIDGRKHDVVTEGGMAEKGDRVRVVKVEGNRVVVKKV